MQEAQTWRALLGTIIRDTKEKQRIIDELGITAITLTRWINGNSDPRPQNLRHLVTILPQYREQLLDLLRDEGLKEFSEHIQETAIKEIPSEFYSQVFVTRASTTENLRFWSTCQLILQQALTQLDPDHKGMAIWVVCCMPRSGPYQKVRSLREMVGLGTPPWPANLEQIALFLGAESLAGNVVTLCRPGIIQNLDEEHNAMFYPREEHEKSSAIYPILYAGRIAGVLMIESTQYNHFLSQERTMLAQSYADLIALAFEPEDFYAPDEIALSVMPTREEQQNHFANYRQILTETMIEAAIHNQPVNTQKTDMQVLIKLEEELLKIPLHKQPPEGMELV
ncbi:MAG TPA: GAF domain-containing protein [Ktedonosporobacter sp.]|nr:GAF domain-containing protein [Ktedonosporobacter sp.]